MPSTNLAPDTNQVEKSDRTFTSESIYVALVFGGSCWFLDAFLTTSVAGTAFQTALLPSGDALMFRSVIVLAVAIAAAITSAYLIKELRYRHETDIQPAKMQQDLVSSFSHCAFSVNRTGEITDANNAAAQLFSWPVNMFMPMKIDWLVSEFITDTDGKIESFSDLVRNMDGAPYSVSVIGKALNGRKFVAELSCMPVAGDPDRYIVLVRQRTMEQSPAKKQSLVTDNRDGAIAG